MALEVETGTFTKVSGSSQNVSVGFDPKAIIVWGDLGTTSNGERDGSVSFSHGFSDGTNDRGISSTDQDEAVAEVSKRRMSTTKSIMFLDPVTTHTVLAEADIDFGTGQFTVNWTTNNATASLMHYIVYGGSDITGIQVGGFQGISGSTPGIQSVATDADVQSITEGQGIVMFLAAGAGLDQLDANGDPIFGAATKTDNSEEGYVQASWDDGNSRGEPRMGYSSTKCVRIYSASSGALLDEGDLDAFTSSGFDINWTTQNTFRPQWFFMIIKGGQWEVGNETASTSVTTKTTSTNFTPKGLFVAGTRQTADGTLRADQSFSLGASDATTETSGGFAATNNDAEIHCGTHSSITKCCKILTPVDSTAPTIDGEADVDSFNSGDFILDWTNAAGSLWKFLWVVCGDDAAAGPTRTTFQTIYPNTGTII